MALAHSCRATLITAWLGDMRRDPSATAHFS